MVIIVSEIKVPIAKPIIGDEEIENVVEVLKSGMIAQGPKVAEFEQKFAEWVGAEYGVAVNSGTAALHVALLSAGIGKGDEVITTPFTFIASGNSILYTGAKPVFADIDLKTYTISPDSIEKLITENTQAIMPVQLYGQSANMDRINEIAEKHGLIVIEDAAQAHGAMCNGEKVGSLGDMSCFSFLFLFQYFQAILHYLVYISACQKSESVNLWNVVVLIDMSYAGDQIIIILLELCFHFIRRCNSGRCLPAPLRQAVCQSCCHHIGCY